MEELRVAVVGAGGAVGRLLVPALGAAGAQVTAVARSATPLSGMHGAAHLAASLEDPEGLERALHGADVVVDLASGGRAGAAALDAAAARGGASRVIRLTCLPWPPPAPDPPVPLTIVASAPVLGSGSAPFEAARRLVERMPVLPCPRWLATPTRPVAAADLVRVLVELTREPAAAGRTLELGGPERASPRDVLAAIAELLGRRTRFVDLPGELPRAASLALGAAGGLGRGGAQSLVERLRTGTEPRPDGLDGLAHEPATPPRSALRGALAAGRPRGGR